VDVSESKSTTSFQNLKDNLYTTENSTFINNPKIKTQTQPSSEERFQPPAEKADSNSEINIRETAETLHANIEQSKRKNEDFLKEILIQMHLIKTVIYSKENNLNSKMKDLERVINKQNIATENNDFDLAQELENQATNIKDSIKDLKRILMENEKEMVLLREQEILCIKQRIKVYEDSKNILTQIKKNQEHELDNFVSTNVNKHKNDKLKIKKMNEKLEILKSNLETKKSV